MLERIKNALSQYDENDPEKLPTQAEFFKDLAQLVTESDAKLAEIEDLKVNGFSLNPLYK